MPRPPAHLALALGSGALMALAMPPWGMWPLAVAGAAALEVAVSDPSTARRRFTLGLAYGAGWLAMGIGWMWQFSIPGYAAATVIFSLFYGAAVAIGPSGPWRIVARPAALALAEAVRFALPFGGVPLASVAISQAGGPLAGVVRVAGPVGLAWVVFQIGTAAGSLVTARARRTAPQTPRPETLAIAGSTTAVVLLLLAVTVAPRGTDTGESMRIAAVQGGGEQGTSALDVPTALVTERHLAATAGIDPGLDLDLVLWPENAIRIRGSGFAESEVAAALAEEAARIGAPIAAGITEDMPPTGDTRRFTNAQVVVMPSGDVVSRYDKVRRVPFGEYIPWRAAFEALSLPVDQVPSDAVAGSDPAVLVVPHGDDLREIATLGVVISWEVFFSDRLRDAVTNGGEVVLNPTNGASYTGTIVQTQQIASSRLRAIESGRWVVQAAPTGFSAFVDPDGRVIQRTDVSERAVLVDEVHRRTGFTWYVRWGDGPVVAVLATVLIGSLMAGVRNARRSAGLTGR